MPGQPSVSKLSCDPLVKSPLCLTQFEDLQAGEIDFKELELAVLHGFQVEHLVFLELKQGYFDISKRVSLNFKLVEQEGDPQLLILVSARLDLIVKASEDLGGQTLSQSGVREVVHVLVFERELGEVFQAQEATSLDLLLVELARCLLLSSLVDGCHHELLP